jgi:hypothetical protein
MRYLTSALILFLLALAPVRALASPDSTEYKQAWMSVYTNGITISEAVFVNGQQYGAFIKSYRSPEELMDYWLTLPGMREHVTHALIWNVVPTNEWMNIAGSGVVVHSKDSVWTPKAGAAFIVMTFSGVACGVGTFERDGFLRFTPIYADDPFTTKVEGALPGEQLYFLFLRDSGTAA